VTSAHQLAAFVVLAVALGVVVVGAAAAFGAWRPRLADRLILVSLVAVAVAIVTGGVLGLIGARVGDPLHFLYAVAALLVPPVARYLGRMGTPRRRGLAVAVGGLVLAALWLRLSMTGVA
jgi:hypothetical protein